MAERDVHPGRGCRDSEGGERHERKEREREEHRARLLERDTPPRDGVRKQQIERCVLLLTGDRASPGADRGRDQKPRQL